MSEPAKSAGLSDGTMTDSVRAQILATEHWGLLATRSITWNEIYSRATMLITVLSAAVVAIALVAQATSFNSEARSFALVVLSVVLLVGVMTYLRLGEANSHDIWLVVGMNRLRHAYLELAPELEPYFIMGHHDDLGTLVETYGPGLRSGVGRVLRGTPALVAIINVVVAGAIATLAAQAFGLAGGSVIMVGAAGGLLAAAAQAVLVARAMSSGRSGYQPLFPSPDSEGSTP